MIIKSIIIFIKYNLNIIILFIIIWVFIDYNYNLIIIYKKPNKIRIIKKISK